MDFRLLGPVEAWHENRQLDLGGPKPRCLLAALLLEAGQVVPTDRLIDIVWDTDPAPTARDLVANYVRHLRAALRSARTGDVELITRKPGYMIRVDRDQVDVHRYRRLLTEARALTNINGTQAASLLREALRLWRGPPLSDLASSWIRDHVSPGLQDSRLEAIEDLAEISLRLGKSDEAISQLRDVVWHNPERERLASLWIRSLHAGGRRTEALAAYRTIRDRLIDELGLEPTRILEDAHQCVLRDELNGTKIAAQDQAKREPHVRDHVHIFDVDIPSSRTFTGRSEQLADLHTLLAQHGAVALHGLGGIGKSRLAVEYAHRHGDDYDVIWWIQASDTGSIRFRLDALARQLGVPDNVPRDQVVAALWEVLRERDRWLLIYDDVEDPKDIERYWPRGNGRILVTSRNPAWSSLAVPYEVRPLERTDATAFFLEHTHEDDQTAAADLAATLGDLPLALELARAYMEETQTSARSYLDLLRTHAEQMLGVGESAATTQTVAGGWLISLQRLRASTPEAEQLLALCAFLGPHRIQRQLLRKHADLMPNSLRPTLRDPVAFNRVVRAILRFSLARVSTDALEVHVLLQTVIRLLLPPEERETWAGAATRLVAAAFPTDVLEPAAQPVFEALLTHALAVTSHSESARVELQATTALLMAAARYMRWVGDPRQSIGLNRKALALHEAQTALIEELTTAEILMSAGMAHRDLGEGQEARVAFERALRIREARLGQNSPLFADALAALGMVQFDLDDMHVARKNLTAALALHESHPDTTVRALAVTLTLLGLVLWSLNELDSAQEMLQRALVVREERYGPDHAEVATSLDNLAKVILDQGDLTAALTLNLRALRIRETEHGPSHFHTAISLNHLGYVFRELGELDKALTAHERARVIFVDQFGPQHSHVARALEGSGLVLLKQQRSQEAHAHFTQALDIFEASLGANHQCVAICLGNLAVTMRDLGDPTAARALNERALDILTTKSRLDRDHPDVAKIQRQIDALTS